ncbi:hypothetical protein GCM10008968_12460 [Bacillus horti]
MSVSFLFSFVIGVLWLADSFAGNDYFGPIIYYFWASLPVVIVAPLLFIKQIVKLKHAELIVASVSTGIIYSFLSITLLNQYINVIDYLPPRQRLVLLIKYSAEDTSIIFLGLVLCISIFLVGALSSMRAKV